MLPRNSSGRQAALLPICLIGLVGLACRLQAVACEPSQQQRGGGGAPNELTGQDLFGAEGMTALGAYGRGVYAANAKRARKMSAFMPMRGRKDGRDQPQLDQQQQQQQLQLDGLQAGAPRELDQAAPELSLVRLVSLRAPQPAPSGQLARLSATPRQFVEQLELMGEQLAERQRAAAAAGSAREPIMMEAKYRRAFHPMRGKRLETGQLSGESGEGEFLSGEEAPEFGA